MELRGKNAIVTGATGGLGVAESEALARAGAAVLMVDVKGGSAAEAINAGLPGEAPKVRFVQKLDDPDLAKKFAAEKETPYTRWVRAEGLEIISSFHVPDLHTVELKVWARRGGRGVFLNHDASRTTNDCYVCEIPPAGQLAPQRQMYEEMIRSTTPTSPRAYASGSSRRSHGVASRLGWTRLTMRSSPSCRPMTVGWASRPTWPREDDGPQRRLQVVGFSEALPAKNGVVLTTRDGGGRC